MQKSGRFGKYLQVGNASTDSDVKFYSLPKWLSDEPLAFEDALDFTRLPKAIAIHRELNLSIIVDITRGEICVGVQGFPLRIPVPEGLLLRQVTEKLAMELLPDAASIAASQRNLGMLGDEVVSIRKGRFGPYICCGKRICGLRKGGPDEATITLDEAVELLKTKGKTIGAKDTKTTTKKAAEVVKDVAVKGTEKEKEKTVRSKVKSASSDVAPTQRISAVKKTRATK